MPKIKRSQGLTWQLLLAVTGGLITGVIAAQINYASISVAEVLQSERQQGTLTDFDVLLPKFKTALLGGRDDFGALAQDFAAFSRTANREAALWANLVTAECLSRAGNAKEATTLWAQVARGESRLGGYCWWRIGGKEAQAAAAGNKPLGSFGPDILVAAGEIEADPAKATQFWERALAQSASGAAGERSLYLLARKAPSGRGNYALRYVRNFPKGRYTSELAAQIDPRALTENERLEIAGHLMDRGEYGGASRVLAAGTSPLARYRLGRCVWRLGNVARARELLEEAVARDSGLKLKVHLTRAEMASQRRSWEEAIAHARIVAREHGPMGLDGLKILARTYLRADRDVAAARVDREIMLRYPNSEAAIEGQWRALWGAIRDGRQHDARVWAAGLANRGGLLGAAGGFWLGRLEQDGGRIASAISAYDDVSRRSSYTYYGWRSRMRSNSLKGKARDPGFAIADGPIQLPSVDLRGLLPEPERVILGGTPENIVAEAQTWATDLRILSYLGLAPPDRLPVGRTRIVVAHSVGDHARGIVWAGDDPLLAHPLGFWPALESAARNQGIDPLFFAALVKQESYFDPRSRSWVGAMGLAQLMPFTADWVSRQIPGPRKPLTDPAYNLKLGTWYLSYAGRVLDGQGILQTAAYNAGVGAVKRWRAWYGTDPEAFIEKIPYRETRHYVKKVFGYYWTYAWLYRDGGKNLDQD